MFDDDGNLTDYGTAAIATNIANVKSEKEELNQLMQERAKMAEHRDEYSDTEWADAIQKSDQDIADAVKSIKSAEDSVTTILKNNAKQKLDAINKTIDAYKEAIQTQKGCILRPFLFNCWNVLKTIRLQRRDEISSGVNAMKIEKINCMTIWHKPKWSFLMQ